LLVTRALGSMIPFQMGEARGNRTSNPRTPEPSNAVACAVVVRSIPRIVNLSLPTRKGSLGKKTSLIASPPSFPNSNDRETGFKNCNPAAAQARFCKRARSGRIEPRKAKPAPSKNHYRRRCPSQYHIHNGYFGGSKGYGRTADPCTGCSLLYTTTTTSQAFGRG
jgi:hypothetical protein